VLVAKSYVTASKIEVCCCLHYNL